MTVRIIWAPRAEADALRIYDYIAAVNPHAAAAVVRRLVDAADGLSTFPLLGRQAGRYRELTVVRPYVLVYRVTGDLVEILRVWHGAQDRGA